MTSEELVATVVKRFGQDGLAAELGIVHCENGKRTLLIPVALGMIPISDTFAVALVTLEEIKRLTDKNGGSPPIIGELTTS